MFGIAAHRAEFLFSAELSEFLWGCGKSSCHMLFVYTTNVKQRTAHPIYVSTNDLKNRYTTWLLDKS